MCKLFLLLLNLIKIILKYIFINFILNSICWYHERFQYHIQAFVKSIFMESRNGNILTDDRNSKKMDSIVHRTL